MIFPEKLHSLSLGKGFDQCLRSVAWPSGLRRLRLGAELSVERLPQIDGLRHLECGRLVISAETEDMDDMLRDEK